MRYDLVIKNGSIVQGSEIQKSDIGVVDGVIREIDVDLDGNEVIDASGLYVIPGGIDPHVHLQMTTGGVTSSDDWKSGTIAAAIGGTTTIIDFIDPRKNQTLMDAISERKFQADNHAVIDYGLHMTIIGDADSHLQEIQDVVDAGIPSFKMYTTYGFKLTDDEMINAMDIISKSGGIVMAHCENDAIVRFMRHQLITAGKTAPKYHPVSRPIEAEREAIERVIALANTAHVPLYIVHVSSGLGAEAIQRAQSHGQPVWGETCPQYLLLDESEFERPGFEPAKFVCSPPLRSKENKNALIEKLVDGTMQTIGTDHCPFFFSGQKDIGMDLFTKIPGGIPGIESRLSLTYSCLVDNGLIDINKWVEIISTNPAKIFGLYPRKGCLLPGSDADIVLFDPNKRGVISQSMLHENVDYTPYEGIEFTGCPVMTIAGGRVIARDGNFLEEQHIGRFIPGKITNLTKSMLNKE